MTQSTHEKKPREARIGQGTRAKKASTLAALLPKIAEKLALPPPASVKTSAAYVALLPQARAILDALKSGYTANAIASIIEAEDRRGETFSVETLRNAIKRIADEAKNGKTFAATTPKTMPRVAPATDSMQPTPDAIARLNEDV